MKKNELILGTFMPVNHKVKLIQHETFPVARASGGAESGSDGMELGKWYRAIALTWLIYPDAKPELCYIVMTDTVTRPIKTNLVESKEEK